MYVCIRKLNHENIDVCLTYIKIECIVFVVYEKSDNTEKVVTLNEKVKQKNKITSVLFTYTHIHE